MPIYLAASDLTCSIWVLRSRGMWAPQLLCAGLVAPRHVGSFPSQGSHPCPSVARWILKQWTTKEVPHCDIEFSYSVKGSFTVLIGSLVGRHCDG